MYGEAFRALDSVTYLDWPTYDDELTIAEVAARLISENNIQADDIVGGSSLGGIVAAEIAKTINLQKLILIGSALTPANINPVLKKLAALSAITPVHLLQTFAGQANSIIENKLLEMFSHSEALFIKSMCRAVIGWKGNQEPNCPVAHIHGAKDRVIFPPASGAKIIQNGGHLIAMTHEAAVVEFVYGNI
jgi:pimeloyl-ACP methyl ester carboxylesterase